MALSWVDIVGFTPPDGPQPNHVKYEIILTSTERVLSHTNYALSKILFVRLLTPISYPNPRLQDTDRSSLPPTYRNLLVTAPLMYEKRNKRQSYEHQRNYGSIADKSHRPGQHRGTNRKANLGRCTGTAAAKTLPVALAWVTHADVIQYFFARSFSQTCAFRDWFTSPRFHTRHIPLSIYQVTGGCTHSYLCKHNKFQFFLSSKVTRRVSNIQRFY